MKRLTRRRFLQVMAATAAASALTACGGGGETPAPSTPAQQPEQPAQPEQPSTPGVGDQVAATDPAGVKWILRVNGAKTAALCGYDSTGKEPERVLTLPGEVNGYTITEISSSAFIDSKLREVTIPESIKTIGEWAFSSCENLTKVRILGATTISGFAFYFCKNLESVELNDGITSIGQAAFTVCMPLKSIKLPASLKTIGTDAFSTTGLQGKLLIPDAVKTIGDSAFASTEIEEVALPAQLEKIGKSAFSGTELRSVVVPARITGIESGTFQSCNQLQAVYIPESVKYIDSDAFGMGATGGVFAVPMKTVYYGGTEEAWKKISIEKGNEKLTSAELVFSAKPGDMAL